jgi:hypothetical protein
MDRRARAVAAAAIGGIALYVLIDVALVFLRPGFSVLRSAESDHGSSGHDAWVMDADFLLRMAVSLAVVWALGAVVAALALLEHAGVRMHSLGGLWEKTFLAAELGWFVLAAAWVVRVGAG